MDNYYMRASRPAEMPSSSFVAGGYGAPCAYPNTNEYVSPNYGNHMNSQHRPPEPSQMPFALPNRYPHFSEPQRQYAGQFFPQGPQDETAAMRIDNAYYNGDQVITWQ